MHRDLVEEAHQLVEAFAKEWYEEFLATAPEIAGELLTAVLDYAHQHVAPQDLRRLLQSALEGTEKHPYALTGAASQAANWNDFFYEDGTPLPDRERE